jgi:hypothetical protein
MGSWEMFGVSSIEEDLMLFEDFLLCCFLGFWRERENQSIAGGVVTDWWSFLRIREFSVTSYIGSFGFRCNKAENKSSCGLLGCSVNLCVFQDEGISELLHIVWGATCKSDLRWSWTNLVPGSWNHSRGGPAVSPTSLHLPTTSGSSCRPLFGSATSSWRW